MSATHKPARSKPRIIRTGQPESFLVRMDRGELALPPAAPVPADIGRLFRVDHMTLDEILVFSRSLPIDDREVYLKTRLNRLNDALDGYRDALTLFVGQFSKHKKIISYLQNRMLDRHGNRVYYVRDDAFVPALSAGELTDVEQEWRCRLKVELAQYEALAVIPCPGLPWWLAHQEAWRRLARALQERGIVRPGTGRPLWVSTAAQAGGILSALANLGWIVNGGSITFLRYFEWPGKRPSPQAFDKRSGNTRDETISILRACGVDLSDAAEAVRGMPNR